MVTGQAIRMAREELPLGRDPGSVRRRIEAIEKVLERAFILPGINRPVGRARRAIPCLGSAQYRYEQMAADPYGRDCRH
jgi:hypothetical protein